MTQENQAPGSLWKLAGGGVVWSLIQSWGARLQTFVVAIILAQLLSPEEFGIASTSALLLSLVPMIAEFGFGTAIIRRRDMQAYEANLPFYLSALIGTVMLVSIVLLSGRIEQWAGVSEISLYISIAAGTMLVVLPSVFQEAFYKKDMQFKTLALRRLVSNFVGGAAAVVAAFLGFGVWSFLIQIYLSNIISAIWLWWRPLWVPGKRLDLASLRTMTKFSLPIAAQRLNDFLGMRLIDVLIISNIGIAAYGLYSVGSRLYILLLEMLQRALYDVSLSALAQIQDDRERVGRVYLKTIGLSSFVIAPIFVMFAVLSPEICLFLFGEKWVGVDRIALPLLLLGSLQCVQHMNGAFLTVRGKPGLVLATGVVKTVLTVVGLLLFQVDDVEGMTVIFVILQALVAPMSFWMVWQNLRFRGAELGAILFQATILCTICFFCIQILRPVVLPYIGATFFRGMVLGTSFAILYAALLFVVDRQKAMMIWGLVSEKIRKRRG